MASAPPLGSKTSISSSSSRVARQGNTASGPPKPFVSKIHPQGSKDEPPPIPKTDTKLRHSTHAPTTGLPVNKRQAPKSFKSKLKLKEIPSKPIPPRPPPERDVPTYSPKPKPAAPAPASALPTLKLLNSKSSVKITKAKADSKNKKQSGPASSGPRNGSKSSKSPNKSKQRKGSKTRKKKSLRKMSSGSKSKRKSRKRKRGKRKKKQAIGADGQFIPANVHHQDETFHNVPHDLLIDGIANAKTVHMTLTMASEGNARDVLIYNIYDENKRRLCTAQETSKSKGGSRPFSLTFLNDDQQTAFTLERPNNFTLCCFGVLCCGSDARLNRGPSSEIVGSIRQLFACGKLQYEISDDSGNAVMFLEGPNQRFCFRNFIGNEAVFQIYLGSKEDPSKELCGDMRVYSSPKTFTDDPFVFTVHFISQQSPEKKVVILAAGALMYLSFYENNPGMGALYGNFCWLLFLLFLISVAVFLFIVVWILM